MIYLEPNVEQALIDMNFIKKYEELSKQYDEVRVPLEKRFIFIDIETVKDILNRIGYEAKFDCKEKFFKTKDKKFGKYSYTCYFMLNDGKVDMIWVIYENDNLIVGDPIGMYSRLMIDYDYIIKKPVFKGYEDLEKILRIEFEMFEEFRNAFIRLTLSDKLLKDL